MAGKMFESHSLPFKAMTRRKNISPEDKEVILALGLLKTITEKLMKTIQEAIDEVQAVKSAQDVQNSKLSTYFTEVLNAINRLEAKIVAGADAEPVVAALAPIKQSLLDTSSQLDTKIAEAQITGV